MVSSEAPGLTKERADNWKLVIAEEVHGKNKSRDSVSTAVFQSAIMRLGHRQRERV